MKYLRVNLAIWWMFMSTTFRAAFHLGKDIEVNLRCVKNHLWKIAGQLCKETEKLVRGQTQNRWHEHEKFPSFSIFHCHSLRLLRPCTLGKMGDDPVESWNRQIQWYPENNFSKIWIELMDNLWNSSGRFSQESLQWVSSKRLNRWWENYSVNRRTSKAGSSSRQCLTTLCRIQKEMNESCENNSKTIEQFARRFPRSHWSFLGPGSEKKWNGTYDQKTDGSWDRKLPITCGWISQDQVIRYSVGPVPWRDENQEAKEV